MRPILVTMALVAGCQSSSSRPATNLPAPRPQHTAVQPGSSTDAPEPPTPPAAKFDHEAMVRHHMHKNFDLLRAIERLLIHGKLDEARGLARSLADAPPELELGPWAAEESFVRERALDVAAAPGLDEACRREARLAEACAACHIDTRAQPAFGSPPPIPPDRDSVDARMARHRWAADRLWEGVVGAGDEPWNAGLAVLGAPPIHWPELGERKPFAQALQQLVTRARQHPAADSIEERTRLYGEMLVICTACHTSK